MKFEITPQQMGYPDDWESRVPEGWEVDGVEVPSGAPDSVFLARTGAPVTGKSYKISQSDITILLRPINPCLKYYGHESVEDVPIPEGFVRVGELQKERPEGATHVLNVRRPVECGEVTPEGLSQPFIWLRVVAIPPPKKRYLMIPLDGVIWVDIRTDIANRYTIYERGRPPLDDSATIVEE